MPHITKSSLAARLADRLPHTHKDDVDTSLRLILGAIADAAVEGRRIEIRDFGSFDTSTRPPRVGRNPKTGDQVMVPARRVMQFKAGKDLKERVQHTEK